jgi:hypothetical protein
MATEESQDQEVLTLLPPEPPSTENEFIENGDFVKGQFDYIKSNSEKRMLQTAYQAINILELWGYIKQDPGPNGFIFSCDDRVRKIYNKIEELGYQGHSGSSFGCILRDMQIIAQKGEKEFRRIYLSAFQKSASQKLRKA